MLDSAQANYDMQEDIKRMQAQRKGSYNGPPEQPADSFSFQKVTN